MCDFILNAFIPVNSPWLCQRLYVWSWWSRKR